MLHARDATGNPVGEFSDAGGVFVAFPDGGKNKQRKWNGVVHSRVSGPQQAYTQLSYLAPNCGTGLIILGRLGVIDNGIGVWNYTFSIVGGKVPDANGNCQGNGTAAASTRVIVIKEGKEEKKPVGARFLHA